MNYLIIKDIPGYESGTIINPSQYSNWHYHPSTEPEFFKPLTTPKYQIDQVLYYGNGMYNKTPQKAKIYKYNAQNNKYEIYILKNGKTRTVSESELFEFETYFFISSTLIIHEEVLTPSHMQTNTYKFRCVTGNMYKSRNLAHDTINYTINLYDMAP